MDRVFLDTNIVIDFFAARKPFSEHAMDLFQMANNDQIEMYISAITVNNAYYVLKRFSSHNRAVKTMDWLMKWVKVVPVTDSIIRNAISSGFKDFEDAIQYYSALEVKELKSFVTRNIKDFKKTKMPILTSEEAVKLILNHPI